ncbi:chemotaxis protein CheA [Ideonella sp. DXS22W]|uniref:Chemotaxis protein CheA n=1 Tax=Pseudaquabacterium inlustre TaxID=2984192 RepID=A0ABU9CFI2_9BURK
MSADIDDDEIIAAARIGFLDEAQEMLAQFETALLVMEVNPNDAENLNAAFRAAHTIKGSAGLFGFDAVVAFTHEAETLLEALRSGELAVDERVTALLLQSRDQIERLLAEVRTGTQDPALADTSRTLGAELRALRETGAPTPEAPISAVERAVQNAPDGVFHLSLRFGADALRNGLDPLAFIRYLDTVGEVQAMHMLTELVPPLAQLDPETCHIGVEIRLHSQAGKGAIEDVFAFCLDDCELAILPPDATPADYAALLAQRAPSPDAHTDLLALWAGMGVQLPLRQDAAAPAEATASAPAGDEAAPPAALAQIERRAHPADAASADRRENEADRRGATKDRRSAGGGEEARFIRVRADKLDRLIDLIGELVIASSGAQLVAETEQSPRFTEAALRIHDLVQEARDGALGLRMVPIGETFSRFNRVVRDVCKQLGKEVELQITGGDTELDKSMVETIADPLMHLVRNSLDHGIETADERVAAGKPSQGHLALHAYHESGSIVIEVRDDGRGLNRARILAKAVERELVAPEAVLDDESICQLIFAPGFSTAAAVTNLSGRGVGMDVVKRNIEALRGQIRISSVEGAGTTMQIRLPLTLAIIDGFLTSVGGVSYVMPLELVAECIEVPAECRQLDGEGGEPRVAGHFDLRGEVLPFVDLSRFYRHTPAASGRRSLVVVHDGSSRVGLVVDRLHGEHQTVIKPLGQVFQNIRGLAGTTILGSGEVALILDVPALLNLATERPAHGMRRLPSRQAG